MQEAILKRAKKEEPLTNAELDASDLRAIKAAQKAKREGKTITLEQLKKELGARCT